LGIEVALALVVAALMVSPLGTYAAEPLPAIPGAAGFGIETPAGSGRHLMTASLEPGWDASLVGHWDFDDGTAEDGVLVGTAAIVKRNKGHALRLDGKGSLTLANAKGYTKPGGSFTVMAWVYMTAPLGAVAGSADEAGGHWHLSHVRHGIEKWMFGAKGQDGASFHTTWTRNVAEAKWRHIAAVYDGVTGRMRLYINASKVGDTRTRGVKGLAAAQSRALTIGRGVKGLIDDVMFFSTALTDDQIVALHASRHSAYFGPNKTTVYKVTNLKTEGPGSLRAALDAVGPRVVVFEVSGNIDFTPLGGIGIRNPSVTIAGQTAPSPGITLKGCELSIGTHDVLLQHIRIRTGDRRDPNRPLKNKAGWSQWSERDCMKVGGERVVIDHCSFSWATDELVQSRGRHVTFRHNLFSECLHTPKHHKGGHSKALLILKQGEGEGQNIAVIGNLFAHNGDRTPAAGSGVKIVVANNFMYNASVRPRIGITLGNAPPRGRTHGGPTWATVVGNHFDKTPCPIRGVARRGVVGKWFLGELLYSYTDKQGKYVEEHITDPWTAPCMKIFKEWCGVTVYPEQSKVMEPPVVVPGLRIKPSREVRDWVLANAGARPADRDPVDERIIREVRTRTGDIPQSQDDVGGWPELPERRRKLTIPNNPSGDDDGDGYTNLEEWLHGFAAEVEGVEE